MFFPAVIAAAADGAVALTRIGKFLTAEELAEPYTVNEEGKYAIDIDGDYQWENAHNPDTRGPQFDHSKAKGGNPKEKKEPSPSTSTPRKRKFFGREEKEPALPTTASPDAKDGECDKPNEKEDEKPFELVDLKLQIPRGSFVAIVGRVGSGKVCDVRLRNVLSLSSSIELPPPSAYWGNEENKRKREFF